MWQRALSGSGGGGNVEIVQGVSSSQTTIPTSAKAKKLILIVDYSGSLYTEVYDGSVSDTETTFYLTNGTTRTNTIGTSNSFISSITASAVTLSLSGVSDYSYMIEV